MGVVHSSAASHDPKQLPELARYTFELCQCLGLSNDDIKTLSHKHRLLGIASKKQKVSNMEVFVGESEMASRLLKRYNSHEGNMLSIERYITAVWDIATVSTFDLIKLTIEFSNDTEITDLLSVDQVERTVSTLWTNYPSDQASNEALGGELDSFRVYSSKESYITLQSLTAFLNEHKTLFFPIFDCRQHMRENSLSVKRWEALSRYRKTKYGQSSIYSILDCVDDFYQRKIHLADTKVSSLKDFLDSSLVRQLSGKIKMQTTLKRDGMSDTNLMDLKIKPRNKDIARRALGEDASFSMASMSAPHSKESSIHIVTDDPPPIQRRHIRSSRSAGELTACTFANNVDSALRLYDRSVGEDRQSRGTTSSTGTGPPPPTGCTMDTTKGDLTSSSGWSPSSPGQSRTPFSHKRSSFGSITVSSPEHGGMGGMGMHERISIEI
jgi:hypothetical protein